MKKLSLVTALSLPLPSPANSEKFMGGAAGPGNGAWDHPPGSLADLPIHHHGLFGRMLSVRRTIFYQIFADTGLHKDLAKYGHKNLITPKTFVIMYGW